MRQKFTRFIIGCFIAIPAALAITLPRPAFSGDLEADPSKLLGSWVCPTDSGAISLVFQSESLLLFNGEQIPYAHTPGIIHATDGFFVVDHPYRFQGENLVITFPEGYQLVFTRPGGAGERSGGAPSTQGSGTSQRAPDVPGKAPGQPGAAGTAPGAPGGAAPTEMSDLVAHFSGLWCNTTPNTQTWVEFSPTGEFAMKYEGSYSGTFENQYGDQTGNWGTAAQEGDRGRWTVSGNRESGTLILNYADGRQDVIPYRVHVEKGYTYWNEYKFNDRHYAKKR